MLVGLTISYSAPAPDKDYALVRQVVDVLAEVDSNYYRELSDDDRQKLVEDMINGGLEKLDPQIIVIGEALSRHLHYYTGYKTITQNRAGDITMDCVDDKIHFYVSNLDYDPPELADDGQIAYDGCIGSLTVETEYTL